MATKKEILNIEYHTRILVKEALRRYGSARTASKYLEVSDRTVFRYMNKFNLDINGNDTTSIQGRCKAYCFIPSGIGTDGYFERYDSVQTENQTAD
jgi:hypothetical protein